MTNDDQHDETLQPPGAPSDPTGAAAGGTQPGQHRAAPEVGSVAEEAVKLFGALADMARQQGTDVGTGIGGAVDQAAATMKEINDHLATDAAECKYCPVCRTVNLVRETSPEVRAHLTTAASSLLQAAAGLLDTLPQPGQAGQQSAEGVPARGPSVEHIDLDGGEPAAPPAQPSAQPSADYPPDPPDYPMGPSTPPPPAPPQAVAPDPRPAQPESTWSAPPPPPPASDSWTDSWMGQWSDNQAPRGSGQP